VCIDSAIDSMRCANDQTWIGSGRHKCSCGLWRKLLPHVIAAILKEVGGCNDLMLDGHVYQFGVFEGRSMRMLRRMEPFAKLPMFGFDSFQGLPSNFLDSERGLWSPGEFASDPRAQLKRELGREGAPVHFVSGFFNASLQPGLARELGMQPAKYVDVDVDLYSSTSQVLGFMFESGLIRAGTLVGYDDWWSGPCRRGWGSSDGARPSPLETGEGLAHAETARKYGASFVCVAGGCRAAVPCTSFGVIFLVVSINAKSRGDPGFAMNESGIREFMAHDVVCQAKKPKKPKSKSTTLE
jgi:hypothetical protein